MKKLLVPLLALSLMLTGCNKETKPTATEQALNYFESTYRDPRSINTEITQIDENKFFVVNYISMWEIEVIVEYYVITYENGEYKISYLRLTTAH